MGAASTLFRDPRASAPKPFRLGLHAAQAWEEKPGISQVGVKFDAEPLSQNALFRFGLDRVVGQQNQERQKASNLAHHQCCSKNCQKNTAIKGMANASVGPAANELVLRLHDDFVAPILPEHNPRPQGYEHSCNCGSESEHAEKG